MSDAIDKECGGAVDSTTHTTLKVLMHAVRVEVIAHLLRKARDIEP